MDQWIILLPMWQNISNSIGLINDYTYCVVYVPKLQSKRMQRLNWKGTQDDEATLHFSPYYAFIYYTYLFIRAIFILMCQTLIIQLYLVCSYFFSNSTTEHMFSLKMPKIMAFS